MMFVLVYSSLEVRMIRLGDRVRDRVRVRVQVRICLGLHYDYS